MRSGKIPRPKDFAGRGQLQRSYAKENQACSDYIAVLQFLIPRAKQETADQIDAEEADQKAHRRVG